jgi:hypothetical protein
VSSGIVCGAGVGLGLLLAFELAKDRDFYLRSRPPAHALDDLVVGLTEHVFAVDTER